MAELDKSLEASRVYLEQAQRVASFLDSIKKSREETPQLEILNKLYPDLDKRPSDDTLETMDLALRIAAMKETVGLDDIHLIEKFRGE